MWINPAGVSQSLTPWREYTLNIRKGNKVFRHCVNRVAGHVISIGRHRAFNTTTCSLSILLARRRRHSSCLGCRPAILRIGPHEPLFHLSPLCHYRGGGANVRVRLINACQSFSQESCSVPSARPSAFLITPLKTRSIRRNCFWKWGLHWILILSKRAPRNATPSNAK